MNHWLLQLYLRRVRGHFNTFVILSLSYSNCKLQSIDKVLEFFLFSEAKKKEKKVEAKEKIWTEKVEQKDSR